MVSPSVEAAIKSAADVNGMLLVRSDITRDMVASRLRTYCVA